MVLDKVKKKKEKGKSKKENKGVCKGREVGIYIRHGL